MNDAPRNFTNDSFHIHHRLLKVIELVKTYYKIYYSKLLDCPNPLIKTTSSLSNNVMNRLQQNWSHTYLQKKIIIHKILVI